MTDHEPLIPMGTDGFPELVYAMYDALNDLLGRDSDLDHEALAPELAHVAWKQLQGSPRISDIWAAGFEAGRIVAMSKAAREKRLESWTDASDDPPGMWEESDYSQPQCRQGDHCMSAVEYVDSRAKEPINSPYKGTCCCGWVTWRTDMESCHLAYARHIARQASEDGAA